MSTYRINRISFGTTGTKTFNVGFQVAGYRITLSKTFTGPDSYAHKSVGGSNGTAQYCSAIAQSNIQGITQDFNDRVVNHYQVTSSISTVVIANHNSITPTSFLVDVTQANSNFQWTVEYWD